MCVYEIHTFPLRSLPSIVIPTHKPYYHYYIGPSLTCAHRSPPDSSIPCHRDMVRGEGEGESVVREILEGRGACTHTILFHQMVSPHKSTPDTKD